MRMWNTQSKKKTWWNPLKRTYRYKREDSIVTFTVYIGTRENFKYSAFIIPHNACMLVYTYNLHIILTSVYETTKVTITLWCVLSYCLTGNWSVRLSQWFYCNTYTQYKRHVVIIRVLSRVGNDETIQLQLVIFNTWWAYINYIYSRIFQFIIKRKLLENRIRIVGIHLDDGSRGICLLCILDEYCCFNNFTVTLLVCLKCIFLTFTTLNFNIVHKRLIASSDTVFKWFILVYNILFPVFWCVNLLQ